MDVIITGLPDDITMQELATRCRLYRKYGYAAESELIESERDEKPIHVTTRSASDAKLLAELKLKYGDEIEITSVESEQDEKPMHIQAAVICGHIHNRDYGLAESKARLLRDRLQKGDWTLGTGTETDRADDGFVRMQCDVIDNMGQSAQRKEPICAFCGCDDPSVICGGYWFCDIKCAKDHAGKSEIAVSNANHIEYLDQVIEDRDKTIDLMAKRPANRKAHIYNLENTINEHCKTIEDRDTTIDRMERKLGNNEAHIHNIWGIVHQKDITLVQQSNTIDDLESQLVEKQAIIDTITTLRVNEVGTLYNLKAELSARKEDSKVLMTVVEIVKRDDCCPTIINQLADLLVDYLDAPEVPPETSINDK